MISTSHPWRLFLAPLAALSILTSTAVGQLPTRSPIRSSTVRVTVDSGKLPLQELAAGNGVVFRDSIHAPAGSPWVQLWFGVGTTLPEGTELVLTSTAGTQRIDQRALEAWGYRSAYFNDSSVTAELRTRVSTGTARIQVDRVRHGLPRVAGDGTAAGGGSAGGGTVCGSDDRVLASDGRVGRLDDGGTGFIVLPGILATAASSVGAGNGTVEFNVPLSQPNGQIARAAPDDQYAFRVLASGSASPGDDWAICEITPTGGLLPSQRNGVSPMPLAAPPQTVGSALSMLGYGTTSATTLPAAFNFALKDGNGQLVRASSPGICYSIDTSPGDGGAPVLDSNGDVVAIHSRGDCQSAGCNDGTSSQAFGFQAALSQFDPRAAAFEKFGFGCPQPPVFYEALTNNDLSGRSFEFTPLPNGGWSVAACTNNCFDPNLGTNLMLVDDELRRGLPLGFGFSVPGHGTTTSIDIDSNGSVGVVPNTIPSSDFDPTVSEFLDDGVRFAVLWTDLNPDNIGAGVFFRSSPTEAVVTWSNVPEFPSTGSNTMQLKLLASGGMLLSYGNNNTANFGFVGYSPDNVTVDPGSIDLSAATPFTIGAGGTDPIGLEVNALPRLGSTAELLLSNMPLNATSALLRVGANQRSIDLGTIGAPGCRLLTSNGAAIPMAIGAITAFASLPIPNQSALIGLRVNAQAVVAAPGINGLGIATSDGGILRIGT